MAVAWNALMNMPNPGVAFTQGFENARTRKLQEEQLREERAFRMEGRQMERDKFQFERQKAALDAHRENIELGAEIIAAVQPKDQAGWDMALGMARQRGVNIEALGVPTTFDPEYASAIARLGGGEQKAPGMIREYEEVIARGLVPQGTTYEDYVRLRNPGMQAPIVLPHNVRQVGGGQGGDLPRVSTPDEAMRLPPGTQFMLPDGRIGTVPAQGGPTPQASGGFPPAGN